MDKTNVNRLEGVRILVAEDDRIGAAIIRRLLEIWQVEFDLATTGEEAVAKAARGNFDLILMDLEMPDLDGCDAAALIRAGVKNRPLPIIGLSGHSAEDKTQKCLEAGMVDYIPKPFDPQRLFFTITKHINK